MDALLHLTASETEVLWSGRGTHRPSSLGLWPGSALSSLPEEEEVSPSFPLLLLLKELVLCFGYSKSIPTIFCFQKQLAKSLQPI